MIVNKRIAVLITVYNRKSKTLQCLEKLFAQSLPEKHTLEVYLTDDGCTDGTPESIRVLYPQVNIINGDGTLFWNRGMYRAWQEAAKDDYDFYLWLNDDTYLYGKALSHLIKASFEKRHTAIIVGATESSDHKVATFGGKDKYGKISLPNGTLSKIACFNGNIVWVPRHVYLKLGNLDYYYRHWKGDTDYGMRATKVGIEMFQAGEFLGECDLNYDKPLWCDPSIMLHKRIKLLFRPDGRNPREQFHFDIRYYGLLVAIYRSFRICLRCLFPILWLWFKRPDLYTQSLLQKMQTLKKSMLSQ